MFLDFGRQIWVGVRLFFLLFLFTARAVLAPTGFLAAFPAAFSVLGIRFIASFGPFLSFFVLLLFNRGFLSTASSFFARTFVDLPIFLFDLGGFVEDMMYCTA